MINERLYEIMPTALRRYMSRFEFVDMETADEGWIYGDLSSRRQLLAVYLASDETFPKSKRDEVEAYVQGRLNQLAASNSSHPAVHEIMVNNGWEAVGVQHNRFSLCSYLAVRYRKCEVQVDVKYVLHLEGVVVRSLPMHEGFWAMDHIPSPANPPHCLATKLYYFRTTGDRLYRSYLADNIDARSATRIPPGGVLEPYTYEDDKEILKSLGMTQVIKIIQRLPDTTVYVGYDFTNQPFTIERKG